jgi:hypothetical protein
MNISALSRIRACSPSNWTAVDLHLRPHGHQEWPTNHFMEQFNNDKLIVSQLAMQFVCQIVDPEGSLLCSLDSILRKLNLALTLRGIIFSSNLCLSLQNVMFLQVLWTHICRCVSLLVCPAHFSLLNFVAVVMFGEEWHLCCCSVFSSFRPSGLSSSSIPVSVYSTALYFRTCQLKGYISCL